MGVDNKLVLCQATGFALSFILSFFMFIPISVNQKEFDGNCLLYADGQWNTSYMHGTFELIDVQWGPHSACNFTIFMGVVLMLLSFFYIILISCYLLRSTDSSWLESFITAAVCLLITLMLFGSTLSLTVGFKKWCTLLTEAKSEMVSCAVADFIPFAEELHLNTQNFYTEFKVAEFGSWVNLVCWSFLSAFAVIKLYRYQQHESFMSSVGRERQRLLQKVGHGSQGAI